MNCHDTRALFPELLDPHTLPTAHLEARTHLAGCPDCQREFAALTRVAALLDASPASVPSARLRQNFQVALEAEKRAAAASRTPAPAVADHPHRSPHTPWWRWIVAPLAACALLALGFLGGVRFAPIPVAPSPTADPETRRQLAELQQQVNNMGQLVGYSLLLQQQRPTNDRLRAVNASATVDRADPRVINELISALALDPSAHVRLRALDGLLPHLDQEAVRAGVLACLSREENPLVQVSMIDFLATARDAKARPAIEDLSLNERADRSVRDAAQRALVHF